MDPSSAASQHVIVACLARVRRRLYAARLRERCALALAAAAVVALFLLAGRLLGNAYPILGGALTLLPLAAAIILLGRARRWAKSDSFVAQKAGVSPKIFQLAAVLAACASMAALAIQFSRVHAGVPLWWYPVGAAGIFLVAAIATTRPVASRAAAIFVDQQAGLQERVSTALEFFDAAPASAMEMEFRRPVLAAAVEACAHARSAKVAYARLDRRMYALAATVALAAAALSCFTPLAAQAAPGPRIYVPVAQKGNVLAKKLNEMEANRKVNDPALDKKMAELRKIAEAMRRGTVSPFEANEKLSSLAKALEQQKEQEATKADVEKAMEASKETQGLADASKEVKSAALSSANNSPGAQLQRESAGDKVQKAAAGLAGKLGGMSDKQKQALSKDLQAAADKAGEGQLKRDLQDASKAAASGDAKQLEQKLAAAGNQMGEQGAQSQLSSDQIRQAMNQIDQAQSGGLSQGEQQALANSQNGNQNGNQDGNQNQNQNGDQSGNQNGGQNGAQNQNGGQKGGQQGGQKGGQPGGKQGGQPGEHSGGQPGNPQSMADNGSTNFHEPGSPGGSKHGGPIGGTQTFVKIYDEQKTPTRGNMESTPGHINPLGTPSGSIDTLAAGDKSNSTIATYESELPAARKRTLDDLETQPIPPQDKDLIRAYYDK